MEVRPPTSFRLVTMEIRLGTVEISFPRHDNSKESRRETGFF